MAAAPAARGTSAEPAQMPKGATVRTGTEGGRGPGARRSQERLGLRLECDPRPRGGRSPPPGNDAFPCGAWPRDAAVDTRKQAGRQSTALTGTSSRSCHMTKRFRILATLKQGNKSMYSNISGYVHMGLRLDRGKGITGQ